jgi:hypothetical protein
LLSLHALKLPPTHRPTIRTYLPMRLSCSTRHLLTIVAVAVLPAAAHAQNVFDAKAAGHVRDAYLGDQPT